MLKYELDRPSGKLGQTRATERTLRAGRRLDARRGAAMPGDSWPQASFSERSAERSAMDSKLGTGHCKRRRAGRRAERGERSQEDSTAFHFAHVTRT